MPILNVDIFAQIRDVKEVITQNAHGFTVGQVLRCDNITANLYVLAQADTEDNAKAVGVVSEVTNINNFVLTYSGRLVSGVAPSAQGTVMYLSDTVAGSVTGIAPSIPVRIYEISQTSLSAIVNIDFSGGGGGGSVVSVTGDSVDNTDPANPVVNAIPLSGTNPGVEVTGDIEIQNSGVVTTFIEPEANGLTIHTNDGPVDNIIQTSDGFSILQSTDGSGNLAAVFTEPGHSGLSANDATSQSTINVFPDNIQIANDLPAFPGMEYAADYSANFNNRSIVDKEYVDNAAGSSAIVYLTRIALQALITGSTLDTTVTYAVNDAVGSTIIVFTWAATNNTLQAAMIDQTNTRFGFYNIVGDTFLEVYQPAFSLLPLSSGGTNKNITAANGGIPWIDADSFEVLAPGSAGQFLLSGGAGAPTWGAVQAGPTNWVASDALAGFSSTTTHVFTYSYNPYTKVCHCVVSFSGTSNATTISATLPFTSAAIDHNTQAGGVTDNGTATNTVGRVNITASGNTVIFMRDRINTAFVNSGTKTFFAEFFYLTA